MSDDTPDYIVFRHGLDVPVEYWSNTMEGRWQERSKIPVGYGRPTTGPAVAEPTGRFEYRSDGAVAEVWEIRLTTPNERRGSTPETENPK